MTALWEFMGLKRVTELRMKDEVRFVEDNFCEFFQSRTMQTLPERHFKGNSGWRRKAKESNCVHGGGWLILKGMVH